MPPSRKPVSNRPQTVAPSSARRVTASGLPSPLTPSPAGHKAVIGGSGPLKLSHRSGSSVPALATTTAGRSSHPAPCPVYATHASTGLQPASPAPDTRARLAARFARQLGTTSHLAA
ncbi:hypothetical protein PENSPDRAFT_328787 [Peniophora sp. CONT]|nr:hypothetical protein PENSPDRAFT_328787 [Peniophora sp. CONT]